jgi:hypothetical protein
MEFKFNNHEIIQLRLKSLENAQTKTNNFILSCSQTADNNLTI